MRLSYSFYNRNVVEVARDLLGKKLVCGNFTGIIVETEAYGGDEDEASHAFRGITPRSAIMFGPAGKVYVYMIYGMYYCFNIVTGDQGKASAVLIRGLHLSHTQLDGPGKLCRHLGITKAHNNIDLNHSQDIYLLDSVRINNYKTTPRIGIKKALDKQWRFIIQENSRKIRV